MLQLNTNFKYREIVIIQYRVIFINEKNKLATLKTLTTAVEETFLFFIHFE